MATIQRIEATTEQIDNARKGIFSAGYGFNDGQVLNVSGATFVGHYVDGVASANQAPVIKLKDSNEVIYLRSFLKEHFNYKDEVLPITGTLNLFVRSLTNKTMGEVVDTISERLKDKSIRAIRKTYQGVNRQGNVQSISYNEFNFID